MRDAWAGMTNLFNFPMARARLAVHSTLAAWLSLAATQASEISPSHFSKGPYLQAPSETSMTIVWETRQILPARVRYGRGRQLDQVLEMGAPITALGISTLQRTNILPSGAKQTSSYSITNTYYIYEATLPHLQSSSSYRYQVELGSEKSSTETFRTFGRSPAETRFIVYGDSRSNPDIHAQVARRFLSHRPDFILHTGDLVARGRDYSLWSREFFDPLKGIIDHVPVLPAIGNHEDDGANYLNYFHLPPPERWYSFDLGPVHVLALDYHYEKPSHEQFAFAQQDLRASRAPWKIVFLHIPMFNIGGHASSWGHDAYLPLFHETRVDLVIAGHSHLYERFRPIAPRTQPSAWPIAYVTSGGGGAGLHPSYDHPALACRATTNHFIVFDATSKRLRGRTYLTSGKVLDEFSLTRNTQGRLPGQPYPEEWLRTYAEAADSLTGRLATLPTNGQPWTVSWKLQGLTNAPGPVQAEIRIAAESSSNYVWVGTAPQRFAWPAPGQAPITLTGQVQVLGNQKVTGKSGSSISPPLVFEARLISGEMDITARGGRSLYSPPTPAAPVSK